MSESVYLSGPYRCYKRYGGFSQTSPLTLEEQKYDDTCRAIDVLQAEIGNLSSALFTATELMWFSWFVNKTFFFPEQAQLDTQLQTLSELRDRLKAREH